MLSRVAQSVYWMSRSIERAENVGRFIDVNLNLTLDLGDNIFEQWMPLIYTTGDHELFLDRYHEPTQRNVLNFLAFDSEYSNSIISCLRSAREAARSVREVISNEMWQEINKFYLMVRGEAASGGAIDDPIGFFTQIRLSSDLFLGVTENTMSRDEAWHFSRLGRLLERADKTSRILDVKYFLLLPSAIEVGTPLDVIQWSALLKSASALQMYRKNRGRITPANVADFLILDREFPRSIHYCLLRAEESLHAISGTASNTFRNSAEQQFGRLRAELDFTHIDDIIAGGLHEFCDHIQTNLNVIGDAIHDAFFAAKPSPQPGQRQRQSQG